MADWPQERVTRRCGSGHEQAVLVPEGWMPGEELLAPAPRCMVGGCSGWVDLRSDAPILSVIGEFVCERCGMPSKARHRRGEPLDQVLCGEQGCFAVQDQRPASFTFAQMQIGGFRLRCEVCFKTWETAAAEFALECPRCRARCAPVDLPLPPAEDVR